MRLRTFFPNLLTNVPLLQRVDQLAAEEEGNQQRRDRRVRRAKCDVLENVEGLYEIPILVPEVEIEEFVKEVLDHVIADCQLAIADLATSHKGAQKAQTLIVYCAFWASLWQSPLVFTRQWKTLAQRFDNFIRSHAARAFH